MAFCSENSLDGSYINRNIVNEVKGPAPVAESKMQNVKQLIAKDINKNAMSIFESYFIM